MKELLNNVISLVISIVILWYVIELEINQCECAIHWNQKFIKYFTPVIILFIILMMTIEKRGIKNILMKNNYLLPIFALYIIINLVYLVNLIFYFIRLKRETCVCAENWKQWALIIPSVIFTITFVIGFYIGFKKAIQN